MSRYPKLGTIKYIQRDGDCSGEYKEGEEVTFKWHRRWKILKVTVRKKTVLRSVGGVMIPEEDTVTSIKLEKIKESD